MVINSDYVALINVKHSHEQDLIASLNLLSLEDAN